jgi:hypothetical protein
MRSDDRPVFVNVAEVDLPVAPDDMGVHTDHAAELISSECAPSAEVAGNDDEEEGPTSSSKIPGGGRPPPPPTVASSKQPTDGTEEGDKGADLPTASRPPSRRRCLRVFGFLGSICIAVGIYFYLLLKRSDVLLQPEEISIAFENGGIQTNVTMKSQFLPGGVWDQFAIRFGKAQCSVSSRIEDKRPGYLLRDGTSRHLFDVRLVGDGSGHKISNGLTRRGVWQFALESVHFETLRDSLWAMRSEFVSGASVAISIDFNCKVPADAQLFGLVTIPLSRWNDFSGALDLVALAAAAINGTQRGSSARFPVSFHSAVYDQRLRRRRTLLEANDDDSAAAAAAAASQVSQYALRRNQSSASLKASQNS